MRRGIRTVFLAALTLVAVAGLASAGTDGPWRQVHPYWQRAYIFSFRSPDELTEEADEQWGREDGRLVSGGILHDFPFWLRRHEQEILKAREEGRPILLAIHTHGGYGTGLVTYTEDLMRGQVANYPWLVRQLLATGLCTEEVTVTVDTCNGQTAAAHQLRPDLIPRGVEAWDAFATWRKADSARRKLRLSTAYQVFAQDRVRQHLAKSAQGSRANVEAAPYFPLTPRERALFRARLYGPRGVILATPTFFNVLRLGPDPRHTNTANLLRDRLETKVLDGCLDENKVEFARFTEFAFLAASGPGPGPERAAAPVAAVPLAPKLTRDSGVEGKKD
jgi:hypothetical protein